MSKLPNAPLLEIIFELRWEIKSNHDLQKYQYLPGDLYSKLGSSYPEREILPPPEVPIDILKDKIVHRFWSKDKSYPIIQVGPGVITLNTNNAQYNWEDFFERASKLIEEFFNIYKLNDGDNIYSNLIYHDFFKFDFNNNHVHNFINNNFNISLNQNFITEKSNPKGINLGFFYEINEGNLAINIMRGKNGSKGDEGIILKTNLSSHNLDPYNNSIIEWLNNSHEYCSTIFKKIIKEELYNTFNEN